MARIGGLIHTILVFALLFTCEAAEYKTTPLHKAAKKGNLGKVERLLNPKPNRWRLFKTEKRLPKKADINAQDKWGETPLHRAVRSRNLDVVKTLLAFPNIEKSLSLTDDLGNTPLHFAVWYLSDSKDNAEIVQTMLEKGAKVDAQNDSKNTPLHYAAAAGKSKMVEKLLAYTNIGNIWKRNTWQHTPLDIATPAIKEMIRAKMNELPIEYVKAGQ